MNVDYRDYSSCLKYAEHSKKLDCIENFSTFNLNCCENEKKVVTLRPLCVAAGEE
jgi:hypothetical protein